MDAWKDEGRLYLLDQEPTGTLRLPGEEDQTPQRAELESAAVLNDATSFLIERGRFEAASILYACQLELVVGDAGSYGNAPAWVNLKAPAELVFALENMERDLAWFVREAITASLPAGYEISEFMVQAQMSPAAA